MSKPPADGTAGPSLWQALGRGRKDRPPLEGTAEAELAVVGGGFSGLSTALHAAQRGVRVVLLEAERIAWGASGRNAGFVVPNFAKVDPDGMIAALGPARGERLAAFAAGSAELVFDLIARHQIECSALQSGWIQPAHSAAAFERVKSRAAQWASRGRPVRLLSGEEIAALTGARGYAGGWTDLSGGVLDPVEYTRGLADAAEGAGARLFEQSRVVTMERSGGAWTLGTGSARLRAEKVLLATNAYGAGLGGALSRTYFPLRVFQIATAPLPAALRRRLLPGGQCVSDTRRNLFTFRFDRANRLISGGMHIWGPGAEARVPQAIWRRLARRLDLPDLPQIAYAWSGMAAVSPDFLPRLVDLGPGLVAGFACNGRGIAMTTAMGRELAAWAAGADLSDLALPVVAPAPLPFHRLLSHAPNALLPWSMLRDKVDELA